MKPKLILMLAAALALSPATAVESAYNQGVMAYREKDYATARQQWSRAVEEHVRAAHNNLGYLLFFGLGGPAEPERAVGLWTIAARQGDREAQWHLASAYEEGKGVDRDLAAAYAWYRCAQAGFGKTPLEPGDEEIVADANTAIARLVGLLSPDDVRTAELLARQHIAAFPYSPE